MKAIITVGVSASGKTTWAKQFAKEASAPTWIVSRDDIRRQILESKLNKILEPGELWRKWKWKDEDEVTKIALTAIADAAFKGVDLIIADTNLNKKFRDQLIADLEHFGYDVEIKLFPVTFDEACKRDACVS